MTTTYKRPLGWQSAVIRDAHIYGEGTLALQITMLSGPMMGQPLYKTLDVREEGFAHYLRAVGIEPHMVVADVRQCALAMQGQFILAYVRQVPLQPDSETTIPSVVGVRPLGEKDRAAATAAFQEIASGSCQRPAVSEATETVLPRATPFPWHRPETLAMRDWVYGRTFLRGAVTVTVGHGGSGKSILGITEMLAMASGKSLLGVETTPKRVWYINLEDTKEELARRITATALAHNLQPEDFGDRVLVNGSELELCIARSGSDGIVIDDKVVNAILDQIIFWNIDVMIVDPFVSTHAVNENDNKAIDAVAKQWAQIASQTESAIHLIHHSRKTGGDEVTAEDGRGAIAFREAARVQRQLNSMTRQQAEEAGVEGQQSRYFYLSDGKANYAARNDTKAWFQFVPQVLPNAPDGQGDEVGVVQRWEWPDTRLDLIPEQMEAVRTAVSATACRRDYQAHDYIGKIVAKALGIETTDKQTMRGIRSLIARWTKDGALAEKVGYTAKREEKMFVEIRDWSKAVCRT